MKKAPNRTAKNLVTIISMIIFMANCSGVPKMSKQNSLKFSLILSPSLETRRSNIQHSFELAINRINQFSIKQGWNQLTEKPFILEARIFDTKDDFDKFIIQLSQMPKDTILPKTYSAVLENEIFVSVAPDLYIKNYPQGEEPGFFEKLIAHEIAHRLHVRVLNGNEDAMGPLWFFEGFAIYAADQFNGKYPTLTEKQIGNISIATHRGSYLEYASMMHYFLKKTSIKEMVVHASKADFIDWLKSLE